MTDELIESRYPLVTVLMPIRNEAAYIERSLGAVLAQDYPAARLEVLVIDGASTDTTRLLIKQIQAQHPQHTVRVLDNPSKIVSVAMNIGLRRAHGEIIVRVDGHTVIESDYVRQCVSALQRTGADNVGGKMNAVGENTFGQIVALATSSRFGVGGARFHYSDREEWVDTVYLGAWRKDVFKHIGLFDEELVRDQDDEFNYRLRAHGGRILLCPAIRSIYFSRSSPRALWRQYFQYGLWKVRVLQKHPRQMRLRQFAPPVLVAVLLGSVLLALFSCWGLILFAVIAGAYLLANIFASFITAAKKDLRHLPLLPIIFSILHLGYGLGFLAGLFRFWNRWCDKRGKVPPFRMQRDTDS